MPKYMCIKKCFRAKPDGVSMHLYKKDEVEEFKNDKEAGNHFLRQGTPKEEMKRLETEEVMIPTSVSEGVDTGPKDEE